VDLEKGADMNTQTDGAVMVGVAESVFKGWALRWAAEQAQLEGRTLALVNASGPVLSARREYGNSVPSSSDVLREHGEELLARARAVVAKVAPDVPVEVVFDIADPSMLLNQLSSTAHLLVLGSRGRGPIRSHLLGSVGLAAIRHAVCPVVVHRPGDHPGHVHSGVVVAAETTADSRPVLEFAFHVASLRRLPLTVVHYVYDVRSALVGAPMSGTLGGEVAHRARTLSECLAGYREDYPDVRLVVETRTGLVPEQDLRQIGRDADLTVVGSHQRRVVDRILTGSVAESVLEHACGAVAVVPTVDKSKT
jgi:nucleotide-binding universal stress UspA family protein